jgi:chemotaxis protein methyltransferase WspC
MLARQEPDQKTYSALAAEEKELQQLIELVVVPETWFFRDHEACATLARYAIEEWRPAHPDSMMQLLSLPCATGEEAYSMAMALLDAGLPASRFRIDAIDISIKALARAREAVYGRNSFRSTDLSFRDRYFTGAGDTYLLSETVRRQVHFQPGNLVDEQLLPGFELLPQPDYLPR